MPTLCDLLSVNPIAESLASFLSFASLLNLSRINSSYRAALHGFPSVYDSEHETKDPEVRQSLRVGYHDTNLWRQLKSVVHYECSWPGHKKGDSLLGCRTCSMPICEACILKDSFKKRTPATKRGAFDNRGRNLCRTCWKAGNPLVESLRSGPGPQVVDYVLVDPCRCTAKDGVLCGGCKEEQTHDLERKVGQCAGYACGVPLSKGTSALSMCIWCSGVLWSVMAADPIYADLKAVHDHLSRGPEVPKFTDIPGFFSTPPQRMTYADQRVPVARWSTPSAPAKRCVDRRV